MGEAGIVGIPVGAELGSGETVGFGVSEKSLETGNVFDTGIPRLFMSAVRRSGSELMKSSKSFG